MAVSVAESVRAAFPRAEVLPVLFQAQPSRFQPFRHNLYHPHQIALAVREQREVVHVSDVVRDSVLSYKLVERLQHRVCEPLGEISANRDAVDEHAFHQIEDPAVLHQFAQPVHHDLRRELFIKMVYVEFRTPSGTLAVVLHPFLDCFYSEGSAASFYGAAAERIHPPHHRRLKSLYENVVDVLIGPESRFRNITPFFGVPVIPSFDSRFCGHKSALDDFPKFFYPFVSCEFHPHDCLVWLVVSAPSVRPVHDVDSIPDVCI